MEFSEWTDFGGMEDSGDLIGNIQDHNPQARWVLMRITVLGFFCPRRL